MARSAAQQLLLLSVLFLSTYECILAKPVKPAGDLNKADATVTAKTFELKAAAAAGAQGGYDDGTYYRTDNGHYEMPYGEEDDCPNPQTADTVNNAYMAHYSFVWADLAQQWFNETKGNTTVTNMTSDPRVHGIPHAKQFPTQRRANGESLKSLVRRLAAEALASSSSSSSSSKPVQETPPAAEPKGSQNSASPDSRQDSNQGPSSTGPASKVSSSSSSSSSSEEAPRQGDEAIVKAHPNAVTNPGFLLPTSSKYDAGRGFEGTSDEWIPTDEAIAVGPHPGDSDSVLVMHGVNRVWEIFAATKDGEKIPSSVHTKIPNYYITQKMGFDMWAYNQNASLGTASAAAFYDKKEDRYVIAWLTNYQYAERINASRPSTVPTTKAPIVVCASEDANALGRWNCWALDPSVDIQPFNPFCAGYPVQNIYTNTISMSYNADGIFFQASQFCLLGTNGIATLDAGLTFLSTLLVFSKKAVYSRPPQESRADDVSVMKAAYFPSLSWFRSLPAKDQVLLYDASVAPVNGFNSHFLASLPQTKEDVHDGPVFVMGKVDGNRFMSIAQLTDEPLDKMDSIATAPRIYATMLAKPDFSNVPGSPPDAPAVIPQPNGNIPLQAAEHGNIGSTHGATHHRGLVYMTTPELYGSGVTRHPSIYWAIIDPSRHLCKPSIYHWGVVASEQGLALSYPVIAARHDCGAVLAYAYGGDMDVRMNGRSYPAYAGAATSIVGCTHSEPEITIIKRGEIPITRRPQDNPKAWGAFSAVDFVHDTAWFAVPVALENTVQYGSWIWSQHCGSSD